VKKRLGVLLWRHTDQADDEEAWLPLAALEPVRRLAAPHVAVHGGPLPSG
jgi:hypothetical protein